MRPSGAASSAATPPARTPRAARDSRELDTSLLYPAREEKTQLGPAAARQAARHADVERAGDVVAEDGVEAQRRADRGAQVAEIERAGRRRARVEQRGDVEAAHVERQRRQAALEERQPRPQLQVDEMKLIADDDAGRVAVEPHRTDARRVDDRVEDVLLRFAAQAEERAVAGVVLRDAAAVAEREHRLERQAEELLPAPARRVEAVARADRGILQAQAERDVAPLDGPEGERERPH